MAANSKLNITKFSVQCLKQPPNHIVDCREAIFQQELCDSNDGSIARILHMRKLVQKARPLYPLLSEKKIGHSDF